VALERAFRQPAIGLCDARTVYDRAVNRKAVDILKEALALPGEERAALAGFLLDSLETDVVEDVEAAWATEVNRRLAELDSGAVKLVPWAKVRRRLASR